MDCTRVDEELVGFQLAAIDGATRAAVETHLTGCMRCVSAYLALKRAIDAGEGATGPSEVTRMRIRKAAEKELAVARVGVAVARQPEPTAADKKPGRPALWIMTATAAAVLLTAPFAWKLRSAKQAAPATTGATNVEQPSTDGKTVDTARAIPDSLAFL